MKGLTGFSVNGDLMASKILSPNEKVSLVTVLALLIFTALILFSYNTTTQLFNSFDWVYHTHEVIEKIGTLADELTNIQRSTRGYVITGDEKYLAPYEESLKTYPSTFAELIALTQDNPHQQKNLGLLKPQIDNFINIYSRVVLLRKTVGERKITAFIKTGTGLAAMNEIMKTIDLMTQEEKNLLLQRNAEEAKRAQTTRETLFIMALIAGTVIIGAGININHQIKAEKRNHEKLREKDSLISQFLEALPIGVFVAKANGTPYYLNKTAMKILGREIMSVESTEKLTETYQAYLANTDEIYPSEKSPIYLALKGQKSTTDDMEIHQPGGDIIPIQVTGTPIYGNQGEINYALTAFVDISERKKYQAELRTLSIQDELTGLLNRRGFTTLAEMQIKTADRLKNPLLMLFIDLDGLKQVNDTLGHQTGDDMIIEFSNMLKDHFRKEDITARMGGDEFAILARAKSLQDTEIVQRFREKVRERNASSSSSFLIECSIGSAFYDPLQPCRLEELVSLSDKRMYEEKNKKKNDQLALFTYNKINQS